MKGYTHNIFYFCIVFFTSFLLFIIVHLIFFLYLNSNSNIGLNDIFWSRFFWIRVSLSFFVSHKKAYNCDFYFWTCIWQSQLQLERNFQRSVQRWDEKLWGQAKYSATEYRLCCLGVSTPSHAIRYNNL